MENKQLLSYDDKGRMSSVLSSIGDGLITTDDQGNIDFMNQAAQNMTGWSLTAAKGIRAEEIFNITLSDDDEVMLDLQEKMRTVIESGKTSGLKRGSRLVSKDGTKYYLSASISPIFDNEGNTHGIVIVFRDITSLVDMEMTILLERNNLRAIFEHASFGMLIIDENALIQNVNKAFAEMLGEEAKDIINKPFGEGFVCSNSLKKGCGNGEHCSSCTLRSTIYKVVFSGLPAKDVIVQKELFLKGVMVNPWYKINFIPIISGKKTMVMVTIDDITEQLRHKEILEDTMRASIRILDNLPVMVWKSVGMEGCDYLNQTSLDYFGLDGKNYHKVWDRIHPDDQEKCFHAFEKGLNSDQVFTVEMRIMRGDGVYRWVIAVGSRYHNPNSTDTTNGDGVIGILHDITGRKEVEDDMRMYHLLLEKARDVILFTDLEGNIIEANQAAVNTYGYTREELLSNSIYKIRQNWDYRPQLNEQADKVFFEIQHYHKDGRAFPVEVSSQSVELGDRRIIMSVVRDITERKQYELILQRAIEQAETANKTKGEFLANMSHEIRTPLNGIVGMIDLTLMTELDEEQRENLGIAKSCAGSLLNIINDILDFSKIEAGKLRIMNEAFDLTRIVEEIIKEKSINAQEKRLQLEYDMPDDLNGYLVGDANRIKQVINNLINNAIKFTNFGKITLRIEKQKDTPGGLELKFSVIDSGIGISQANIRRLFKSFSQIDSSLTKQHNGSGLGLAICKQLVEMMNGHIWVDSQEGKGSTFSFILPFNLHSRPTKTETNHNTMENGKISARILLAEDDKINQKVVTMMLNQKGYTVDVADNGLVVMELYHKNYYDLILMDIQMPKMDGIETTRTIRRIEGTTKHIPIIALTAFALEGDKERFISVGMDHYVAKPVSMGILFNTIEAVLSEKNSIRSLINEQKTVPTTLSLEVNNKVNQMPYKEKLKVYMRDLESYLDQKECNEIERVAHELKTIFESSGDDVLKSDAFKIELAARRNSCEQIKGHFERLNDEVHQLLER